jgi:hypothetical protein
VIEDSDVHERQGLFEAAGDELVGLAKVVWPYLKKSRGCIGLE